jgi:hypothetical protein
MASAENLFMDTIDRQYPIGEGAQGSPAAAVGKGVGHGTAPAAQAALPIARRPVALRWLLHDIPYIAMLLLALVGVVLRLPVIYWVILTPVFGIISIAEGRTHFVTRTERLGFVFRITLDWCALLLAIYLLYNSGVQGVMNANATSLGMMILLALGTFVAGIQARVWQIRAVGGVLFLSVPGLGWLDQSPLMLAAGTCVIIALGGVAWWLSQGHQGTTGQTAAPTPSQ